jgi:hypothetical protein
VARGGHLIVVTYSLWDDAERRPDWILDRFGLRQHLHQWEPSKASEREDEEPRPQPLPTIADVVSGRILRGDPDESLAWFDELPLDQPLSVEFDGRFYWEDADNVATWSIAGDNGLHLIELAHGAGTISALTDDLLLRNDQRGKGDHAEFAVRWLRRGNRRDGPVWILFSEQWPGLFALLRTHAWPALLGLGALVALWLWRAPLRFGPLALPLSPERRRWMQHLEAVGRFHWRRDRARTLLGAMQQAVREEIGRRHPAWLRLTEAERAERIAGACGLRAEEVAAAFSAQTSGSGAGELVAAVSVLERVREV